VISGLGKGKYAMNLKHLVKSENNGNIPKEHRYQLEGAPWANKKLKIFLL
jgi:hypothetical protein